MQADPRVITKAWYDELLRHYTEAQVMELAIFVAINLGFHAVFSTLEFPPAWDHIGPGGRRVERALRHHGREIARRGAKGEQRFG